MSLQGHERATRIIAEALQRRADDAQASMRETIQGGDTFVILASSTVAVVLAQLALGYLEAANEMEDALRAPTKATGDQHGG